MSTQFKLKQTIEEIDYISLNGFRFGKDFFLSGLQLMEERIRTADGFAATSLNADDWALIRRIADTVAEFNKEVIADWNERPPAGRANYWRGRFNSLLGEL